MPDDPFMTLTTEGERRRAVGGGLALAGLMVLLLFGVELSQPRYFSWDDNASVFLPFYTLNWRAAGQGTLPFVNFHQYLGHTFLAQGQTGALYPPSYLGYALSLLLFGDARYTIDILVIGHLTLAAVAMYALLLQLRVRPTVSWLQGLAWATLPFLVLISKSWVWMSYVALYVPLNFLLLERLLEKPGWRRAFWLGLAKSAFFAQGYIQYLLMTICFEALYVLISWLTARRDWRTSWRPYVGSFVVLTFLVLPLLATMFHAQQVSAHRSQGIALQALIYNSMTWRGFLDAQWFRFEPGAIFAYGDGRVFHAGLLHLLGLGLLAWRAVRQELAPLRWVVGCAALTLLALACSTQLYGVMHRVPLLNLFRWPFKYFLLYLFFSSLTVTVLVDAALRVAGPRIRTGLYALIGLTLLCNLGVTGSGRSYVFRPLRIAYPPRNEVGGVIDPEAGRLFTFKVTGVHRHELDRYQTHVIPTLRGTYHIGGYDPIISRINHQLCLGLNYHRNYQKPMTTELLDYLSLWGVRYIVTRDTAEIQQELAGFGQLELRLATNGVRVYENQRALPMVRLGVKPVSTTFGINAITARPGNRSPAELVFAVAPLPFYTVWVDGKQVSYERVLTDPIRVEIPAGTREVRLVYRDYPFFAGLALSALFWVVVVAVLFWRRKR